MTVAETVIVPLVVLVVVIVVAIGARSDGWTRNVMAIIATYLRPGSCRDLLDRLEPKDDTKKKAGQPGDDEPGKLPR